MTSNSINTCPVPCPLVVVEKEKENDDVIIPIEEAGVKTKGLAYSKERRRKKQAWLTGIC